MTKNMFHRERKEQRAKPPPPKSFMVTLEELKAIREAEFAAGEKAGFGEGVKYIVARFEDILCRELGFNSREELVKSGKMPAVWIAALVQAHGEDYEERMRKKAEEAKEQAKISSDARGK